MLIRLQQQASPTVLRDELREGAMQLYIDESTGGQGTGPQVMVNAGILSTQLDAALVNPTALHKEIIPPESREDPLAYIARITREKMYFATTEMPRHQAYVDRVEGPWVANTAAIIDGVVERFPGTDIDVVVDGCDVPVSKGRYTGTRQERLEGILPETSRLQFLWVESGDKYVLGLNAAHHMVGALRLSERNGKTLVDAIRDQRLDPEPFATKLNIHYS